MSDDIRKIAKAIEQEADDRIAAFRDRIAELEAERDDVETRCDRALDSLKLANLEYKELEAEAEYRKFEYMEFAKTRIAKLEAEVKSLEERVAFWQEQVQVERDQVDEGENRYED